MKSLFPAAEGLIPGSNAGKLFTLCLPTKDHKFLVHVATLQSPKDFPSGLTQVRALAHHFACWRSNDISSGTVDSKCTANLFSAGRTDVASFYDIWQGVTAMFSVCVRKGYSGSVRGIGTFWNNATEQSRRDSLKSWSRSRW